MPVDPDTVNTFEDFAAALSGTELSYHVTEAADGTITLTPIVWSLTSAEVLELLDDPHAFAAKVSTALGLDEPEQTRTGAMSLPSEQRDPNNPDVYDDIIEYLRHGPTTMRPMAETLPHSRWFLIDAIGTLINEGTVTTYDETDPDTDGFVRQWYQLAAQPDDDEDPDDTDEVEDANTFTETFENATVTITGPLDTDQPTFSSSPPGAEPLYLNFTTTVDDVYEGWDFTLTPDDTPDDTDVTDVTEAEWDALYADGTPEDIVLALSDEERAFVNDPTPYTAAPILDSISANVAAVLDTVTAAHPRSVTAHEISGVTELPPTTTLVVLGYLQGTGKVHIDDTGDRHWVSLVTPPSVQPTA